MSFLFGIITQYLEGREATDLLNGGLVFVIVLGGPISRSVAQLLLGCVDTIGMCWNAQHVGMRQCVLVLSEYMANHVTLYACIVIRRRLDWCPRVSIAAAFTSDRAGLQLS
jgi:hypothetical protein